VGGWPARSTEWHIFDLAARRPKVRTKAFLKSLDKGLVLRTVARFALLPRGGPWPLEGIGAAVADGSVDANAENVQYHYDVSNKFYALWLDRELVYSCGYFANCDNDIDRAQQDKLDMICRKLRLQPGETLLDIGCGWGALSCYAAQHYGVNVHAVTLAKQQAVYGQEKIERLGLSERVKIEIRDYSTVEGMFDKVVSVGMYEHVGIRNYPKYYGTIQRVLKPGGLYLHHAITRPAKRDDRAFRRKRPESALLTKYIFPGAELDHPGNTVAMMERSGFEVHDVEGWREHYQRTCRHWHDRLLANYIAAVSEVGPAKARMWLLYLAACSVAFERNTLGVYQTLASKRRRGPSACRRPAPTSIAESFGLRPNGGGRGWATPGQDEGGTEASPPRHAHVPRERGALVAAVDDEIVALGLAADGFVDGASRRSLASEARSGLRRSAASSWPRHM